MTDALTVTDVNGRPSKIVYECLAGEIVHIKPVSLALYRAIQQKAIELFPLPDSDLYTQPEENAFDPAQRTNPNDNPEYIKKVNEVESQRKEWVDKKVFDYAVSFPRYETKDDLVAAYQNELTELRKIADLPKDDYEAILFYIILAWNAVNNKGNGWYATGNEFSKIIMLAIQTIALSPPEVAAGIRFFRPKVSERAD